jgi:hypothetical protein
VCRLLGSARVEYVAIRICLCPDFHHRGSGTDPVALGHDPLDPEVRVKARPGSYFFSFSVISLLVTVWWATFRWEHHEPWTFPDFALLCVYMSWFYVMTMILYPANQQSVPRFNQIRTRFYAAFIIYCLLEIPVMIVRDGTLSPWYYLPMMIHLIVLSTLGIVLRRDKFDSVFAGWLCLINIVWPFAARMTG